ncbi:CynX/NimT family MFS transporter [Thalassospira marina]|uniref:MFS transporter n=1 Tax=Thalassospira marina TaxID=2048283 RepID=A0ABM6QAL0_9PROT|nr:MFS transporter [Thalassospira marina]AUG53524.1 MFS transporter [Thalassospira marina]
MSANATTCSPPGNLTRNAASHSPAQAASQQSNNSLSFAATLACIVLIAIDLRPGIVSIGPLLPQLRAEFGLSNLQASLLTAIPTLFMGLLALPSPWLVRRFGLNRVILGALGVLTIATAARAFAPTWALLLLTTAGVGAGIAITGALIGGFVKTVSPNRMALLMGVYAMSLGLVSTLAAGTTSPIAEMGGGWRVGSGIWAILGVVSIIAWRIMARAQQTGPHLAKPHPHRTPLPVNHQKAWLLALYFASNNILFYGFLSWLVPLYRETGMNTSAAGLLLASFTTAFMLANLVPGILSRKKDRRFMIAGSAAITFAGLAVVAQAPAFLPFILVPVIAFGIGNSFTLGMTLPLDNTRTAHEANAWNAFILGIGYGAGALGPLAMGALRDITGGFHAPMLFLVAFGLFKLALSPFLHPPASRDITGTENSGQAT